jgi:DNA polymerase-3 subunit delta
VNLRGTAASAFLSKPDPATAGALIYGADAARVGLARKDMIAALGGPDLDAEMRLTRLPAGESRADPAAILDALKATGFFPGPRIVHVDGATEAQAAPILRALDAWSPGDAALVVTAGALKKTSKLRKAFEAHPKAAAIGLYDDPMERAAIDALIAAEGLTLTSDARRDLDALALTLGPGDFRQTLTKIALYAGDAPADSEAVAAMAPATVDADADQVVLAAAAGNAAAIGPLMRRLAAQGVAPVTLAIFATRHFQQLHGIAAGTARPYGPHGATMSEQARGWGMRRLEGALSLLMETDLTLRSSSRAPAMAVMERALIRLSMMARG